MKFDPPNADAVRRKINARVDEATEHTVAVEFRGRRVLLPVIDMEVRDLHYNPNTHRVRAQLDTDPVNHRLLKAQPFHPTAQDYLGRLLKAKPSEPNNEDPAYRKLKQDLADNGQDEPGIIDRQGVLVNGNTRRAALLELSGGTAHMRVAVLPLSAEAEDIAEIELALQLRTDFTRPYSGLNRLLHIQELADNGTPQHVIAGMLRIKQTTVTQELWMLQTIRSLVSRSTVDGESLPLSSFEDHVERFRELYTAQKKISSPNDRQLFIENRLAALSLGFAKTNLRVVDQSFLSTRLAQELPELALTAPTAKLEIPGLGRSVDGPTGEVVAARSLVDEILQARVKDPSKVERLRGAFDRAINTANLDKNARRKTHGAADRLKDVANVVPDVTAALMTGRQVGGNDKEALEAGLHELRRALKKLARGVARELGPEHPHVRWLTLEDDR